MNLQLLHSGSKGVGGATHLPPASIYILLPSGGKHISLTFISGLILSELECAEDHVSRGREPEMPLRRMCILLIKESYSVVRERL